MVVVCASRERCRARCCTASVSWGDLSCACARLSKMTPGAASVAHAAMRGNFGAALKGRLGRAAPRRAALPRCAEGGSQRPTHRSVWKRRSTRASARRRSARAAGRACLPWKVAIAARSGARRRGAPRDERSPGTVPGVSRAAGPPLAPEQDRRARLAPGSRWRTCCTVWHLLGALSSALARSGKNSPHTLPRAGGAADGRPRQPCEGRAEGIARGAGGADCFALQTCRHGRGDQERRRETAGGRSLGGWVAC